MKVNRLHMLGKDSIISGIRTAEVVLLRCSVERTKQAAAEIRTMEKIPLSQGTLQIPSSGLTYFRNHLPNSEPTAYPPTLLMSSQFGSLLVSI